jgi:hypothetical protein
MNFKPLTITLALGAIAFASVAGVTATAEACHICTGVGTSTAECRYVRTPNGYSHCTVRTDHGSTTCQNGDDC